MITASFVSIGGIHSPPGSRPPPRSPTLTLIQPLSLSVPRFAVPVVLPGPLCPPPSPRWPAPNSVPADPPPHLSPRPSQALKAALGAAGALRRTSAAGPEAGLLIRACRGATVPTLVAADLPLFGWCRAHRREEVRSRWWRPDPLLPASRPSPSPFSRFGLPWLEAQPPSISPPRGWARAWSPHRSVGTYTNPGANQSAAKNHVLICPDLIS